MYKKRDKRPEILVDEYVVKFNVIMLIIIVLADSD